MGTATSRLNQSKREEPNLACSAIDVLVETPVAFCHGKALDLITIELADLLRAFSLDVVKIVAGYASEPRVLRNVELPSTFPQEPRFVAVSPLDTIWVSSNSGITVFDRFFALLKHYNEITNARGIAFDDNGVAYVAAKEPRDAEPALHKDRGIIEKLSAQCEPVKQFGRDALVDPQGVCYHRDRLFVAETRKRRVVVFTPSGKVKRRIVYDQFVNATVTEKGDYFHVSAIHKLHQSGVFCIYLYDNCNGIFLAKAGKNGNLQRHVWNSVHAAPDPRTANTSMLVLDVGRSTKGRLQSLSSDGSFGWQVGQQQLGQCIDTFCVDPKRGVIYCFDFEAKRMIVLAT